MEKQMSTEIAKFAVKKHNQLLINQKKLSEVTGISVTVLSDYKDTGIIKPVRGSIYNWPETALRLSSVKGIDIDFLVDMTKMKIELEEVRKERDSYKKVVKELDDLLKERR